jgi:hypothetical protein
MLVYRRQPFIDLFETSVDVLGLGPVNTHIEASLRRISNSSAGSGNSAIILLLIVSLIKKA